MNRLYKFDNAKFFLIFSVVLCHFLNAWVDEIHSFKIIIFIIYTFHMPAFIFIAGMFSKRNKSLNSTKCFGYLLLGSLIILEKSIPKILRGGSFSFLNGNGWYLLVLAAFMIVTYFLRNVSDFDFIFFVITLALTSGATTIKSSLLLRFFHFFPFYMIGFSCSCIDGFTFTKNLFCFNKQFSNKRGIV